MKLIAHDEGIKGSRSKLQSALISRGWERSNLNFLWPGADAVWRTTTDKIVGVQIKTIIDFPFYVVFNLFF